MLFKPDNVLADSLLQVGGLAGVPGGAELEGCRLGEVLIAAAEVWGSVDVVDSRGAASASKVASTSSRKVRAWPVPLL